MTTPVTMVLAGHIVEEGEQIDLDQLCDLCCIGRTQLADLLEEGVMDFTGQALQVEGSRLRRLRLAARLQQDLGVNAAGAALAVELLERIAELERVLAGFPRDGY